MSEQQIEMNIIGAGLAGLSAARTFAQQGIRVRLISFQPSERAQSTLAEGGINAVLNVMGEEDNEELHFEDTMKGGCDLADPNMVKAMVNEAPEIVREMDSLGVPFHREGGQIVQRNFGGQRRKRTTYAKSSTGKALMSAMTSAVRRYEAQGLVTRYPHHTFEKLILENGELRGVLIFDRFKKEYVCLDGAVLMACGGMNGMMTGATTGTSANTGDAAAMLFSQGVKFANLEFIQYHPTTVKVSAKRLLVSEAARGEGGRLFCRKADDESAKNSANDSAKSGVNYSANDSTKNGAPDSMKDSADVVPEEKDRCYFMEEKYGEKGNLMPRDVISREMALIGRQAYLDMTFFDKHTWDTKLSDLREEIQYYLKIDPAKVPVAVGPGIHYFMGGILVDEMHRTNIDRLYAAGECACAYHGANRLGGNSLLGAIRGGRTAARTAIGQLYGGAKAEDRHGGAKAEDQHGGVKAGNLRTGTSQAGGKHIDSQEHAAGSAAGSAAVRGELQTEPGHFKNEPERFQTESGQFQTEPGQFKNEPGQFKPMSDSEHLQQTALTEALLEGLGPLRSREEMIRSLDEVRALENPDGSDVWKARVLLAEAMLLCAIGREESRGAHTRLDYPKSDEAWRKTTVVSCVDGKIRITYEPIPELRS